MHRTTDLWLIGEVVIGVMSLMVAIIAADIAGAESWFLAFAITGVGLIAVVVTEVACRFFHLCDASTRRFARVRMWAHFLNGLCWLTAFLEAVSGSVALQLVWIQAPPLLAINIWGAWAHANAIWSRRDRRGFACPPTDRRCG